MKGSGLGGGIWGISYYSIVIVNPAVGIRPIRTPDESDSDLTMKWEVSRPYAPVPLDVNIDSLLDGSTASTEDAGYLPSEVHFDKVEVEPGIWEWEQVKIIETAVIDDADAEWTETYLAKVGEGEGYYADPKKKKAEIGDDDLKLNFGGGKILVNNDDSDDDGKVDLNDTDGVSSDGRLYPAILETPEDEGGGDIYLSWPGNIKVWASQDRQGELIPEYGDPGYLNPPEIVYVEAISGSITADDTVLTISAVDKPPETDVDAWSRNQTDNSEPTTTYGIQITFEAHSGQELTETDHPIMIGQGISLSVASLGPWPLSSIEWAYTGYACKGVIDTEQAGNMIFFEPDDLHQETFKLYWWKGDLEQEITVTADIAGEELSCKAMFDLTEPEWNFIVDTSEVTIFKENNLRAIKEIPDDDFTPGMQLEGQVDDGRTNSGTWKLQQIVNTDRWRAGVDSFDNSFVQKWSINGQGRLDAKYGTGTQSELDTIENLAGGPIVVTVNEGTANGKKYYTNDSPGMGLIQTPQIEKYYGGDTFNDFILYKPTGTDSIFVPLVYFKWHWHGHANLDANDEWELTEGEANEVVVDISPERSETWPIWLLMSTNQSGTLVGDWIDEMP